MIFGCHNIETSKGQVALISLQGYTNVGDAPLPILVSVLALI